MKKLIIFSIILLVQFSVSNSQWLEKEGYWELSEKIPDLRDLKIIPEENLVITVSKDNTIRHIEYDSGKILKSGKPAELTEENDYAKISSDGKTTVVARYVKNEKYSTEKGLTINDLKLTLLINSDFTVLADNYFDADSLVGVYKNIGSTMYDLKAYNYNIAYFDYLHFENNFILVLNYTINYEGYPSTGGPPDIYIVSGKYAKGTINNQNLEFSIIKDNHWSNEYNKIDGNFNNRIFVGRKYYSSGSAYSGITDENNFIGITEDNFVDFEKKINYQYTSSYMKNQPSATSGERVPIYQLFNSNKSNIFYYTITGKLVEFDIQEMKIENTFQNPLFNKFFRMSNDSKLIHTIESKDYVIHSFPYIKEIYRVSIDTSFALPRAFLDEIKGSAIIPNVEHKLILIKSDAMSEVSKFGFDWSKDTVYTNEEIKFRALTNITGCKFEWTFDNGDIIKSDSNEISHKFMESGKFGVTLIVTKPDGEKISFTKDSIITVTEIVKANFDIQILNSELPLEVQFTDKSTGNIKSWNWDFGDGESSAEQNPIHEYKFSGDFSPRLIVSNGIMNDTLIKYEQIAFMVDDIQISSFSVTNKFKTGGSIFEKAFKTTGGFNLNWTYYYSQLTGYLDDRYYFVAIYSNLYDLKFNKVDSLFVNFEVGSNSDKILLFCWFNPDRIIYNYNFYNGFGPSRLGIASYSFYENKFLSNPNTKLILSKLILNNNDKSLYFVGNAKPNPTIVKTDISYNTISELSIQDSIINQYLADTFLDGLNLIIKIQDNSFKYYSISSETEITTEKSFSLDTNITLSNIKSVHENLILLHGYYNDKVNNTTYAYFAKYHPVGNTLQDTILYSRKDIRKLERVNNSTYAAIGQSRGRQGYLLLDTNLHQIKDIRVDSLTGEIKDMILHDNKVYLFTEKIVSLETMALGDKESYQTTASVLGLPEDIIADVDDNPVVTGKSFTHSAYPNPANDVFNLKVVPENDGKYSIKLYDIFGVEIFSIYDGLIKARTEKIFSIPTSSLSIGSYYYVISGGGIAERGKVMVVR